MSKVAVIYWSGTGNTQAMAEAIAEAAKSKGAEVDVLTCSEVGDLSSYDSVALGCPAMGAEELEDSEFLPMLDKAEPQLGGKKVTGIGDYAFSDCSSLRSITIPDSVTSIGDQAFLFCRYLTSVTLSEGLTKIGDGAFSNCGMLTSVTIPYGVTDIGDNAFYNCQALTSVTIPDTVARIGKDAFSVPKTGNGSFTAPIEGLTVTVPRGSCAEQYCRENGLKYAYSD